MGLRLQRNSILNCRKKLKLNQALLKEKQQGLVIRLYFECFCLHLKDQYLQGGAGKRLGGKKIPSKLMRLTDERGGAGRPSTWSGLKCKIGVWHSEQRLQHLHAHPAEILLKLQELLEQAGWDLLNIGMRLL